MSRSFAEQNLYHACQTLFGPRFDFSRQFLEDLECVGVKKAFRKKAFETHPDMVPGRGNTALSARNFRAVRRAYENLTNYLRAREKGSGFRIGRSPITVSPPHYSSPGIDGLYRGPFPRRRLLFGHFLYYSGVSNWNTIGRALIWQRLRLPFIGELAVSLGWLSKEDLVRVVRRSAGKNFFGSTAVRLGLLDEAQIRELLHLQNRKKQKLGVYFLEKKILTPRHLEELVARSIAHNTLF